MASPRHALSLVIALLAAGCTAVLDAPAADPGAEAAAAARTALDGVALDGAELVARDGASVTLAYEGGLQETVVMPDGRRVFPFSDYVDLSLTLPGGAFLALDLAARADGIPLVLSVSDGAGMGRCSVSAEELAPCLMLSRLGADEAAAAWTIRVLADATVREGTPFSLDARVRIVEPANGGLPALAFPADDDAGSLPFRAPVMVADVPLHEPSIDITPGGAMYVSGYGQEPGALWRSTDGGASFQLLQPTDLPYCNNGVDALIPFLAAPGGEDEGTFHPGCGDIDVAVSGDEHVYFAHHWNGEAVHASHDGGASWTSSLLVTPELRLTDRAWLAADGERAWLALNSGRRIVRSETGVGATGDTVVSRTLDGGLTWAQVGQTDNPCIPGAFVHSPSDDMLYLGGCTEEGPTVIVSGDGGITWDARLIAERSGDPGDRICYTCGIYTVLDADDAGNLYAAWSDPHDGGTFDVWFAASQDQGATWSAPIVVNGAGGTHIMPWLAAGREGHVALAWYATAQEADPGQADLAVWYAHVAETFDGLAAAPSFVETTASATPVQYGPICLGGASCDSGRNLGDYLQVAFDPQERPVVAYADGRGGGTWNTASRVMAVTTQP